MNCATFPCFGAPTIERAIIEDEDETPIEINYDSTDVTYLYQAIEDKAFMAAIDFLESGKPEVYDECRTWVTRYEKDNEKKIRWSQLPLHAAMVFKAPTKLVELLIKIYPKAVRCTDDQSMLPLHLAFRNGASDGVLWELMKSFPEAVNAKDSRGRTPLQLAPKGDNKKKGDIIGMFEENAKKMALKKKEELSVTEAKLMDAEARNIDLQNLNETLMEDNTKLKDELEKSRTEMEELKMAAAAEPEAPQVKSPLSPFRQGSSFRSPPVGGETAEVAAGTVVGAAATNTATKKKKKSIFKGIFKRKGKGKKSADVAPDESPEETTPELRVDDVKEEEEVPTPAASDDENAQSGNESPEEHAVTEEPAVVTVTSETQQ